MRTRLFTITIGLALTLGCTDKSRQESTLTQRERDSIIGQSSLPGAGGVRGAQAAADSAEALNRRLEAIGSGN